MAAVLAKGKTLLHNLACEPEILDLTNFLILQVRKSNGLAKEPVKSLV